ncbi:alpha-L-fucosidase [Draconibacterium orientale]|jgi:alpha-L-fucosidase|uniref:alpha-L-fucosidase n=1 Tax=Draconibacterium orientale TaxID=1168034 RepID=X5D914_9BACT|nr:alpha-L-fucosidase [Draconibacterium orientale]AHW59243.1 alpha-L-fucosidase [Draconibacterium orientale]SET22641.1 alpha-L-fucosidase [Draconibacterium orientale]
MKRVILLSFLSLFITFSYAQKYKANWKSIDSRPIPQWFEDVKFGIFIHWGVYSVPAWAPANADIGVYAKYAEWYGFRINDNSKAGKLFREYHNKMYGEDFLYQDFAPRFKAQHWNPEQWAELFKRAGARYVVLTSKHHEGFTLWPSAQSWNWNSVDIGPHRDICGDLTTAVKNAGLHMGFYYSLYEWYNPLYHNNLEKYVDNHMILQMKDLVTSYEPDILWTDGEWDHPSEDWKSTEFLAWLYNESPVKNQVCVNDRWGEETRSKHGGFYTTEYDLVHDGKSDGLEKAWEECRGIGTSFGYNQMETVENYMSSEALIHLLIEKVAGGGNLLLDVGPTADGRIPVIQQQRLLDIGTWLKTNGEAIYETRKWEGAEDNDIADVYFTKKGKDLYVHCTKYPTSDLKIKGLKKASSVSLLGYAGDVKFKKSGKTITLSAPVLTPGKLTQTYAWVFKLENVLK